MRPQVTVYLSAETKRWLVAYAARLGLPRTDMVRCLLERERQVRWLEWALQIPDPGQSVGKPLPRRSDRLPRGYLGALTAMPARRRKKR